ncbi:probable secreted glycosyl hydrolase [Lentisphaera araneosa HTCC2155]|uniref:Probable secreted glycosyl hydrolase n=1 Tax=Lentisphaera araneosa HTCC2155 TaxID=313628 RepID=A6DP71_9BACT|nr:DUF1080 domain-containing protein [Lentisphaera araneosa]EDM26603.1 probable secreted glycosyl hydrolase [Lentisphaera araneosa HTCC2155]
MKNKILLMLIAGLVFSCVSTPQKQALYSDPEFKDCMNVYNDGHYELKDGVVHMTSKKNFFFPTKKRYADFILEYEVKMPDVEEYSNSGLIFRAQIKEGKKGKTVIGYQAEVDPSERAWSGGLYDQGRRGWLYPKHATRSKYDEDFKGSQLEPWTEEKKKVYKHLEWNKYRVECRGSDIKIFLNGTLMTHVIDTKDAEGHIAIQHHGSKEFAKTAKTKNMVQFRNITIQELEPAK